MLEFDLEKCVRTLYFGQEGFDDKHIAEIKCCEMPKQLQNSSLTESFSGVCSVPDSEMLSEELKNYLLTPGVICDQW